MARFGKHVVMRNNMTPEQHQKLMHAMAARLPEVIAEIDGHVAAIAEIVANHDPISLLQRGYWVSVFPHMLPPEETETREHVMGQRMVDYVQSIIAAVPPKPHPASEVNRPQMIAAIADQLLAPAQLAFAAGAPKWDGASRMAYAENRLARFANHVDDSRVKILTEFLQKVSKEQLTGVISVAALLVVGLVLLLGKASIPAYNFSLPQTGLGFGLLAVAAGWGGLAFLIFRRNRNGPTNSESIGDENALFGPVVLPEPPKIRVQVTGEGEGMSFWKNDGAGELRAWLDVVNFTSAPVKIDRILGDITVANATVATLSHFKRQNVAAVSATSVFVHAELSSEHIKKIEFQLSQQRERSAGLNLTVYVITEKGELELHPRLVTGNCRFVNFPHQAVT